MASTEKAVRQMRDLADRLRKFVAATLPVVTETLDSSDQSPIITLSADATPAFGEKVIVIRMKAHDNPLAQTSLGGATPAPFHYAPHVIQICTEANFAGTTDNIADILTPVELLPVLSEVAKIGSTVEWYQSANGTVPSAAQMTSGNLKATYRSNLYWGSMATT